MLTHRRPLTEHTLHIYTLFFLRNITFSNISTFFFSTNFSIHSVNITVIQYRRIKINFLFSLIGTIEQGPFRNHSISRFRCIVFLFSSLLSLHPYFIQKCYVLFHHCKFLIMKIWSPPQTSWSDYHRAQGAGAGEGVRVISRVVWGAYSDQPLVMVSP